MAIPHSWNGFIDNAGNRDCRYAANWLLDRTQLQMNQTGKRIWIVMTHTTECG
jgi:hypothetical protein